jgi:hypothetical protein
VGREFARQLTGADLPESMIHIEDQPSNTWQNVELSLPYLREALSVGQRLAVVSGISCARCPASTRYWIRGRRPRSRNKIKIL